MSCQTSISAIHITKIKKIQRTAETWTMPFLCIQISCSNFEHEIAIKSALGYSKRNRDWFTVGDIDSKKERCRQILIESLKHYIEVEIEPIMKMPLAPDSMA